MTWLLYIIFWWGLVWTLGFLFSAGLVGNRYKGHEWYVIILMIFLIFITWPLLLGWLLRDFVVEDDKNERIM